MENIQQIEDKVRALISENRGDIRLCWSEEQIEIDRQGNVIGSTASISRPDFASLRNSLNRSNDLEVYGGGEADFKVTKHKSQQKDWLGHPSRSDKEKMM